MSEQQNAATAAVFGSFAKAFAGFPGKLEISESAREFVQRSTATAKERAAALYDGANKTTDVIEGAIVDVVNRVGEVNRKLMTTAYEDAQAALAAIDKLATAKSAAEAYQVQADYWRERGEVGLTRAKEVAAFLNTKLYDGIKAVETGAAKIVPGAPTQAA